LKITLALGKLL